MSQIIVRIMSARDGFRRAGIAHGRQAVDYPTDAFSALQLEQLCNEPVLTLEFITLSAPSEPDQNPEEGVLAPACLDAPASPLATPAGAAPTKRPKAK